RGHALRSLAGPCARGRHVLHALLPRAAGPARRRGVPQPFLPSRRRARDRRAPEAAARDRSRRNDRRRPRDVPHRRGSLRLRGRADDASGRSLRDEPDAGEARPDPRGARMSGEAFLTRNFGRSDSHTIRAYVETGGYQGWAKARSMEPTAIVDEVKRANLRSLGGAGFTTGTKWSFLPTIHTGPVVLVVTAASGCP